MLRSLVGSEMCIRDRYQRRVRGWQASMGASLSCRCDGDLRVGCVCGCEDKEFADAMKQYQSRVAAHREQQADAAATQASTAADLLAATKARSSTMLPASEIVSRLAHVWVWRGSSEAATGWNIAAGAGLLLGTVHEALDSEFLKRHHVTHVVNCTEMDIQAELRKTDPGIHVTTVAIPDDDSAENDLYAALRATVAHVKQALASECVVLVHCERGVSRSATVVAACVMQAGEESDPEVALQWLRARRSVVDPNQGFRRALESWGHNLG
eukprot:TRINITY_DN1593_c0_g1_i2.p1 TRINITY_DN1593_c0_g1~~TRINITY_DN1593_c0_g1_i2.p1  ORF type:complete len:269 (+),score=49.90 TRINITY_DN1593_c0_g1_i2:123-929(+)